MPNLEETGLLNVTYAYVDDLAADTDRWGTDTWTHMPDALTARLSQPARDSCSWRCSTRCAATCASAPRSSPKRATNASRASPRPT